MVQTTTPTISNRGSSPNPSTARVAKPVTEEAAPLTGRLLTARDVARHLGVSLPTLIKWHSAGKGPARIELARNVNRYTMEEVKAFVDKMRAEAPTSK
jgi:predicted DNA-binding transcriptional regulator AlpA